MHGVYFPNVWLRRNMSIKYDIIRHTTGMVSLSKHARARMAKRKVNFQQVLTCLAKGNVTDDPVLANKGGSEAGYEITVERSAAGERLRVGVCLRFSQTVKVITVIKIK